MSNEERSAEQPEIKVLPRKTIVRKLAVGQQVEGRVKRLVDFGAFVDIGVGTDALVHVSEVSVKRINKPADVLSVGQEVTGWIKKLDKTHNRISLTLIPPGTRTIKDLKRGEVVSGTVTRITDYGVFVDIGIGYDGMVHVKEMAHGYVTHPNDVVQMGQEVEAEVLKVNRRRGLIDLSMRAVLPEPEAEVKEEEVIDEEEEIEEEFEEEEPELTAFEAAMMAAQSKQGKKERKRRKKQWFDYDSEEDDDVVSRTLQLADEN